MRHVAHKRPYSEERFVERIGEHPLLLYLLLSVLAPVLLLLAVAAVTVVVTFPVAALLGFL